MNQTAEQRKMDAEGRGLAREHAARLAKDLAPIEKANAAALKSGAAGVLGATDGGSKGLNQRRHAEAKKLGAK